MLNNTIGVLGGGREEGGGITFYFYLSSFEDLVEGNFHKTHYLKNILSSFPTTCYQWKMDNDG
jgi:hypothetical protein